MSQIPFLLVTVETCPTCGCGADMEATCTTAGQRFERRHFPCGLRIESRDDEPAKQMRPCRRPVLDVVKAIQAVVDTSALEDVHKREILSSLEHILPIWDGVRR